MTVMSTRTPAYDPRPAVERSLARSPVHVEAGGQTAVRQEERREAAIDDALAASFPASDPPSWNSAFARPVAADAPRNRAADVRTAATLDETAAGTPGVIDVSRPYRSGLTVRRALASLAGAAGIALVFPFVILLLGLPIALAVGGLLELLGWLSGSR
jgi:hypothetical protein